MIISWNKQARLAVFAAFLLSCAEPNDTRSRSESGDVSFPEGGTFPVSLSQGGRSVEFLATWTNGVAVIDGDILLPGVRPPTQQRGSALPSGLSSLESAVLVEGGSWPGGNIYYTRQRPACLTAIDTAFDEALLIWNAVGIVRFIEVDGSYGGQHVDVSNNCSARHSCAQIGFIGAVHGVMVLGANGVNTDIVLHEMGHVIGFGHEHQRPDRDSYITVDMSRVDDSTQFTSHGALASYPLRAYDLDSVMHYSPVNYGPYCSPPGGDCKDANVYSQPVYLWTVTRARNGRTDFGAGFRFPKRLSFGDIVGTYDLYAQGNTQGARLVGFDLHGLNLSMFGVDLVGAQFTNAKLQGANLRNLNLAYASFAGANVSGADFTGANQTGVNFTGAILTGAICAYPLVCSAQGKNCGYLTANGCGTLYCGSCRWPATCGGAGTAGVCGIAACSEEGGVCSTNPNYCIRTQPDACESGCDGVCQAGTCVDGPGCGAAF